jgi:iron(III) transport system substrate-binding protein
MTRSGRWLSAAVCGAGLALAPPARAAQPSPDLIRQAAAVNGGQVVLESALFDSTNHDFEHGFDAAFGKDGLHLKLVRYQSSQQAQLYDQELRAGKVSADLLFFVEPSLFLRLAREHKLTPYCGVNFQDYRPQAAGPDCNYFGITSYLQYLVYNTDLMKTPPSSWMDLVDPRWQGKVSIPDPKVGGGHYYFVYTIYKLFGKDWFVQAHANDDMLTQSHGVTENQVMSGERYFGVSISVLTRNDGPYPGGKGAPIREAFPKEGGALLTGGLGITKGGPNPAGAKVFVDWITSLEGQKLLNHNGLFSLRKDFTSRESDDLSKLHTLWFDPDDMEAHRDAYTQESERLLATGR